MADIVTSYEPKALTAYQQTYHWRNKNCSPWAQEWIRKELPGIKIDDGKQRAEIEKVDHVSGDCDLGQRKGKLLTIYDLEVELSWKGVAEDGTEVEGRLKIPEVSHEAIDGLSDYTFDFTLTTSGSTSVTQLYGYVRSALPPLLREKFSTFRPALLAVHGLPDASPSVSGAATPAASSSYAPTAPAQSAESAKPKAPEPEKKKVGSTAVVEQSAQLQASADDIWGLLTDANKIPMWSRSPAKVILKPGEEYELFGGNVRGKIVEINAPKKLVQTWQTRSPKWPAEHYGTMTITLDQGSDSTGVKFKLEGVPSGEEADVERALDTFYIRGLKQMGLVLSASARSYRIVPRKPRRRKAEPSSWLSIVPTSRVLGGAAVVALAATLVGLVVSSLRT